MVSIREAELADIPVVRELFLAYAESLGFSLCFQGFEEELASLPGGYAPPTGGLLLAEDAGVVVGCVAFRLSSETVAEMKRLYVCDEVRGKGIGRLLAESAVAKAAAAGYSMMRLDTLPSMTAARALYEAMGFVETEPYYENPVAGAVFLERSLL